MAIIHYDVTFEQRSPRLQQIKDKLDARMGLRTQVVKDSIEATPLPAHRPAPRERDCRVRRLRRTRSFGKTWSELSPAEKQMGWRTH